MISGRCSIYEGTGGILLQEGVNCGPVTESLRRREHEESKRNKRLTTKDERERERKREGERGEEREI
jgi:hypothetical protein